MSDATFMAGVFLSGTVPPLTIVALYPGIYYSSVKEILDGALLDDCILHAECFQDNDKTVSRYDGIILNGNSLSELTAECFHFMSDKISHVATKQGISHSPDESWLSVCVPPPPELHPASALFNNVTTKCSLSSTVIKSPLSIAQFCNHPPAGHAPNVAFLAIDISFDDSEEGCHILSTTKRCCVTLPSTYRNLLSNIAPKIPTSDITPTVAAMQPIYGIALVAIRTIKDEELYVDYQYGGHSSGSDSSMSRQWYHAVTSVQDGKTTSQSHDDVDESVATTLCTELPDFSFSTFTWRRETHT